jgi:hypothetical protein
MKIIKNKNFTIENCTTEPVFQIIDNYNKVIFNAVTEKECLDYIETLNDKKI